jgi:L-amino acid N-acyltransferase YncA
LPRRQRSVVPPVSSSRRWRGTRSASSSSAGSRRSRGFGTDALETVLDACFAQWNLHRVWLRSEACNDRAHRLYRRCGFTHEATLRDASYLDGRYHDVLVFSILEPAAVAGQAALPSPAAAEGAKAVQVRSGRSRRRTRH